MSKFIEQIIDARERDLGGGFKVRRLLPVHNRRMVGPFIFFDHMGPAGYAPGKGMDVRPHPHIGLATVTYLFDGAIGHKDSVGSDLVIRPGAVNWMVAGRGITHSERTPPEERAAGSRVHGIQTWVALPVEDEACEPSFTHHPADTLPELNRDGVEMRVIAGTVLGETSPVSYPSPIWYAALESKDGGTITLPGAEAEERAVYAVEGEIAIGSHTLSPGQMAVLTPQEDVQVRLSAETKTMIAGGAPLEGRRYIDWNLVASSKELIETAKDDWRSAIRDGFAGTRFPLPEGEDEYIPLPEDQT